MTKQIVAYKLTRQVQRGDVPRYDQVMEAVAGSLDVSGLEEDALHTLTYFVESDDLTLLQNVLKTADQECGVVTPREENIEPVYDQDWEQVTVNSLEPLQIGKFYLHRFNEQAPEGLTGIQMPANMAFGSGEHGTTAGCLRMYEDVVNDGAEFANGLDMGCGSGILAIAAAKQNDVPFLCVDNDEKSVEVCAENAENNGVSELLICVVGDGFNTPQVAEDAPYDLIFANILANPVTKMAPQLVEVLDDGGVAIISGFLTEQRAAVEQAYTNLGMVVIAETVENNWVALALQKQ